MSNMHSNPQTVIRWCAIHDVNRILWVYISSLCSTNQPIKEAPLLRISGIYTYKLKYYPFSKIQSLMAFLKVLAILSRVLRWPYWIFGILGQKMCFFWLSQIEQLFSGKNTFFDLGFQIFNMVILKLLTRWLIPSKRPWGFEFLKMGNIWACRIQSWFFKTMTQTSHIWLIGIHNI
jgi:hypothetical protein